jgi:hypothetical protein
MKMDERIIHNANVGQSSSQSGLTHFNDILDRHTQLLGHVDILISQLDTKAYNLGKWELGPNEPEEDVPPPQGYLNQYQFLLDKQEAQITKLERIVNFMHNII